jgi:branched-chain amino acid aminotransferase
VIHIEEVFHGLSSGDCTEIFGCGTAAVVSPVGELLDGDTLYKVGSGDEGPVAKKLNAALTAIQFGTAPDTHGWMVQV